MLICPTLRKVQRAYVRFDPLNVEHLNAFKSLCLSKTAKQHETLRFELEDNFTDVRTMMFHKVGEYHRGAIVSSAEKRNARRKKVST